MTSCRTAATSKGSSRPRRTWRSLRRSRPRPLPICVTPCAGSTTSSRTRARRPGEDASLPGVKKPLGQYGPAGVADTTSGSAPAAASDDDDDIDLFGSDEEEDAAAAKLKEERLAEYAAKKAKKPALIAKSSILLDVKPWDDETDMAKLEECVRSIQMDGLLWGQSKLVPVGYGIKKLQIGCVVEDDKVGTDLLEEHITAFEDYVQSMDVAAFNKI
ncbi:elongation factor 1-beta isoform X2 [Mugil cephalus]|uniref:elongation factor 1-beta isoform X2 n=1 Tax=Mugil cephalus TaxID=48193 RepID=UPI001FB7C38C|nr:elongation factor 1-beta isoform X2 [Mugil cephalus]